MLKLLDIKRRSSSLFANLLASFIVMIALFLAFYFVSYTFLRNSLYEEVLRYNIANLEHSADNYDSYFRLIHNTMLNEMISTDILIMQNSEASNNYGTMARIHEKLQMILMNDSLFLKNIILRFQRAGIAIEQNGSHTEEETFAKYINSPLYPLAFWQAETPRAPSLSLYPAARFEEKIAGPTSGKQWMLPILIKQSGNSDVSMIVLLDPTRMLKKFHQSINDNFLILDRGKVIFRSGNAAWADNLSDLLTPSRFAAKSEGQYYFYKTSAESGLTYVNVIPVRDVYSRISNYNVLVVSLLIAVILVSIATSILFSIRFNNPLKRIIQSVTELNAPKPPITPFREFNMIGERLAQLIQSDRVARESLHMQDSHLQHYGLMNRMKNIYMHQGKTELPGGIDKPFYMVAFQVTYTASFGESIPFGREKASYFIKELIHTTMAHHNPDSLTFQMEQDLIVTLVFTGMDKEALRHTLLQLKHMLDMDSRYLFLTVAVSDFHSSSANFTFAYEQVLRRLKTRKLNEETQLILETLPPEPAWPLGFTHADEQEFAAHLQAGNEAQTLSPVIRTLERMQKDEAAAQAVLAFALEVAARAQKALASLQLEPDEAFSLPNERLRDCHTYEQVTAYLTACLSAFTAQVRKKKETNDSITTFMIDFMETHLGEDLSLDLLADKLKISAPYLSTYFKEKTGTNFIDYLNSLRIRKAKQLLLHSDLKIHEISSRLGYQSVNSFIRMFKRLTGLSPGEYRKSALTAP
ncbi:helix-turn-helix transcriptional regulator [Paenibacillus cymbidii]|uniref:helix-turn-helix transcriptional regulator n=1 Tax=Paenibacillus cymbidii TaxID=1639034 RepID=UPI0010816B01|nr:AraC family transcriptional regulator [Paenibacillus cymbidii]